jgi:very-short-patch-repair endonuclease
MDELLARLAGEQHGVVARRQLLDAGLSRRAIERRLERGSLLALHRGVYAVGHRALTRRGRWIAAALACDAALSHRAAAALWGLLAHTPGDVEVTRATKSRGRPGVAVHFSPLPEDERTVVDAIPVTGVSRTLLDLAAVVTRRRLESALNEAEVLRLTDVVSLPDLLERYPRRPGTPVLRAILKDATALSGPTRNEFEERFAVLLDLCGVRRPRFNADLVVRGRHLNVDCLWEEERLVVELDGAAVHRTARAFEADRERDRVLTAEGWSVIRVTWRQLRGDAEAVVADLRAAAPTL